MKGYGTPTPFGYAHACASMFTSLPTKKLFPKEILFTSKKLCSCIFNLSLQLKKYVSGLNIQARSYLAAKSVCIYRKMSLLIFREIACRMLIHSVKIQDKLGECQWASAFASFYSSVRLISRESVVSKYEIYITKICTSFELQIIQNILSSVNVQK